MTTHYDGGHWQTQLPIDYIDTSLTINGWETVDADLTEGKPARLCLMFFEQTNNGAAAEDIELELTINGTPYKWSQANAASGTKYYCYVSPNLSSGDFDPSQGSSLRPFNFSEAGNHFNPFHVGTVGLIRVRQTSAVDGVAAQIEVNLTWDKLVDY